MVLTQIHRGAAAAAMDDPQCAGQCLNLGWRQRAYEAFFHHEGREGAEMPVLTGAAMNRIGAADGAVGATHQRLPAARAGHVFLQRKLRIITVGVQGAKERQHAIGREQQVLAPVEPDAMTGKAQVQHDLGVMLPAQPQRPHRGAAGGAGKG